MAIELMELKPCPFCGSTDIITRFTLGDSKYEGVFHVICCGCCIRQSISIRLEDISFGKLISAADEAVKKWNTRFKGD